MRHHVEIKMHLFKPRTTVYVVRHMVRSPRNLDLKREQQMQWNGEQNSHALNFLSFLSSLPKYIVENV